jgi:hypothetical protein
MNNLDFKKIPFFSEITLPHFFLMIDDTGLSKGRQPYVPVPVPVPETGRT